MGVPTLWSRSFGWHYLSNATCLIRRHLFCVFRSAKDHHNLLHDSQLFKKTCVRQVVLDRWFPLNHTNNIHGVCVFLQCGVCCNVVCAVTCCDRWDRHKGAHAEARMHGPSLECIRKKLVRML